jgi:hypothetical protein
MRLRRIIGLGLLVPLALVSCGPLGGLFENNTGLVSFYTNPAYDTVTEHVEFQAAIQFSDLGGNATPIEYRILDGATVVSSGTAQADQFDDVLRLWKSAPVGVAVPRSTYSGKDVTVFLDPEAKVSSNTGIATEADRKKAITIP